MTDKKSLHLKDLRQIGADIRMIFDSPILSTE